MIDKNLIKNVYEVSDEQAEAMDISINTALRAGAGSGKTRVLTKRFLRLLKEETASLEQIAAITFTNKAALEMKERIRGEILKEIAKEKDPDIKEKWRMIRDTISFSNINTIHGFCGIIIRENFSYLGIDPEFTVIEEADRETNLNSLCEEVIEESLSENDIGVVNRFIDKYSSKYIAEDGLRENIINIYLKAVEMGMTFEELYKITEAQNRINKLDKFQDEFDELAIGEVNEYEILVLKMVEKLHQKYTRFKKDENAVDFNDLELLTLQILENKTIRQNYFEKFKYVMVDEFQDTNNLQKKILYHLIRDENGVIPEGKLFIVGDHKQAIYGFRGTDFSIFEAVCNDLGKNSTKELSTCYRSSIEIIDTVNKLFQNLLNPFESLKECEDKKSPTGKNVELIKFKLNEEDTSGDLWKKIKPVLGDSGELRNILEQSSNFESVRSKSDKQADIISGRILGLLRDGFEYKDIAILLRSRTSLSSVEISLKKYDIPYSILGGIGFWGRQEVVDIINLYKFITNPEDKVSLVGSLRSPIFFFSDDEILALMNLINAQSMTLLGGMKELSNRGHILRAYNILEKTLKLNGYYSAYELLDTLCRTTSYREILLTQENGYQKVRNLEKLMKIAKDFDNKQIYNARQFISYLQTLEKHSSGDNDAVLDTENSDAVKILTIHASKGLEFNAVIVPDISKNLLNNLNRNKLNFVIDSELGICANYTVENGSKSEQKNPLYAEFYTNASKREMEDSKRVLYVAATRAKNFLAFIGEDQDYHDSKGNLKLDSYMRMIKYSSDLNGNIPYLTEVDGDNLIIDKTVDSEKILDKINQSLNKVRSQEMSTKCNDILWKPEKLVSAMFSISQYIKFLECPRKYFYQYRAGINLEEFNLDEGNDDIEFILSEDEAINRVSATTKGSIIHKILEIAIKSDLSGEELESLSENVVKENLKFLNQEEKKDFLKDIKRYINNYNLIENSNYINSNGTKYKVYTELGFRVPISGDKNILTNGFVDRVDIYETDDALEICIIDYKTNSIKEIGDIEVLKNHYLPQLMIYSFALSQLIKHREKKTVIKGAFLYFLDCGESVKVEFNDEEIQKLLKDLKEKIYFIKFHDKIEDYSCCNNENCLCKIF